MERNLVLTSGRLPEISIGAIYEFGSERIQVIAVEDDDCIVQRYGTRDRWSISRSELQAGAYLPKVGIDLSKFTKDAWARGREIYEVLQRLENSGKPITEDLLKAEGERLKGKLGLRQMQTYRARYLANPCVTSCIAEKGGRKPKSKNLHPRVEEIIGASADKALKSEEGTSLDKIWTEVRDRCENEKLRIPAKDTVWRRLQSRGFSLRRRRHAGPAKFRESMTQLRGKHEVGFPGAEYQIDHTQIDLMTLDDSRRFALGRMWLTLVMDVFSRCIMGFFLSFLPPQIASVQRALAMAVMDKRRALTIWGLDSLEWPMAGIPSTILTDHAREFHSAPYLAGCDQHGITPIWRLVKSWGGHIERLIGRLMGRLHLLPGTTFSNTPKRIGYQPEAKATMTASDTVRYIVTQICEYHDTKHSSLGITPRMQWENNQHLVPKGVLRAPPMPAFFYDFLPEYKSTRNRDGLHWGGYVYNSRVLAPIPVRQQVTYRIDHLDTSRAFVRMPDSLYIEVPRITAVTYKEHSLERQLRSSRSAHCFSPVIVGRDASTNLGSEIKTRAKTETEAARAFNKMLPSPQTTPVEPTTLDFNLPDKSSPSAISLKGEGAFCKPTRILTTTKL
jgi:putative transposase